MRKAVIDVGSNSIILTIEEKLDGRWTPFIEQTTVTSLGEGTKETGLLQESAILRTLAALERYRILAREVGAPLVAYATMAARLASNTSALIDAAAAFDLEIKVLSAEEEAQFGFQSVVTDPAFSDAERISIIDPGGQSTELVTATKVGTQWNLDFRRSHPVGTLGLKSQFFPDETIGMRQLFSAMSWIDESIGLCYLPEQAGKPVVLGASGTNLVSIRERLLTWQPETIHAKYLDYEEVSKAVSWLGGLTEKQRAEVPGMELGRERTIHLGALILERYLYALRVLGVFVSVRGWRHAILEQE